MKIYRIRNFDEFGEHIENNKLALDEHAAFLQSFIPAREKPFVIPGYSYTAKKNVEFLVDYHHSGGTGIVNWRERVCCPYTHYNNRMRATIHLFDLEMEAYPDSTLYLTEQVTPLYSYFADRFHSVVGSEYLGTKIPLGSKNRDGVLNEDLCSLSFPDESFTTLISLDVLEHIPNYELAFRECARVVKPGGRMMWSVPFVPNSPTNMIRAKIVGQDIEHIMPPEYHGDPVAKSKKGILCFQHFGWEMLAQMVEGGFKDAYAMCYQSIEFGYLGGEQFLFVATK